LGLALATASVTFAACGGDDDASADPTQQPAASTTQTAAPAAAYPVKVKDMLGRDVEIKAKPVNIVAISPTAVEYVYAMGSTLVGRSQSADFPEAAKTVKDVGTAYQPNFEAILALKPDLIVADSIIHVQPALRSSLKTWACPSCLPAPKATSRSSTASPSWGKC
jgi:iron complex transport system substrate-binding protein